MPSNGENSTWNDNHNGSRVPVNDTGSEGAPFQLNGSPAWNEGCVAKAVYETYQLQPSPQVFDDDVDAQNYNIHFSGLHKYLVNDMLYGHIGDSRNTVPGNLGAFRGYPTAEITTDVIVLEDPVSDYYINPDGSQGSMGLDTYIVVSHRTIITNKVPYDIVLTIEFKHDLASIKIVEARIAAGSIYITDYREVGDTVWNPIASKRVWFSLDSSGLIGDQTLHTEVTDIVQVPIYGTYAQTTYVITQAEYDPSGGGTPIAGTLFGPAWEGMPLHMVETRMDQCREVSEGELAMWEEGIILFKKYSDPLVEGTRLYKDNLALTPADGGNYLWVSYSWTSLYNGDIYQMKNYIILDTDGYIQLLYLDIHFDDGYLGSPCYDLIPV